MKLRRPRRIFRAESKFSGENLGGRLIAIGLGMTSFAVMLMVALPADLFGRASNLTTTLAAESPQVAVVDGDTLRMRDTLVRLRGTVAPSRGQVCQSGPAMTVDCGTASSTALAGLVRGRAVACQANGRDRHGFVLADCEAAGVNLNHAMVSQGWARAELDDAAMQATEREAQRAKRGLWWGGSTVPL